MLAPSTIYAAALKNQGDWRQQAERWRDGSGSPSWNPDYGDRPALDEGAWEPEDRGACPSTGVPMDDVFARMFAAGLTPADIAHLERLSDARVRRRMGANTTDLPHASRENVIQYLEAWAGLLEDEVSSDISLTEVGLAAE